MKPPAAPPNSPSNKPILAIDFDDTLVFNAQRVVDVYNRLEDGKIHLHDVYVAEKFGNPEHGWHHDRGEAREWIRRYLISAEGQDNPPIRGAKAALTRLAEYYTLVIVTGRRKSWSAGTEPWLRRFLPDLFASVQYCGDTPKSQVCRSIGAEVIIDDSPHYLSLCAASGMRAILFGDYPWTHRYEAPSGVERARHWGDVERLLLHG